MPVWWLDVSIREERAMVPRRGWLGETLRPFFEGMKQFVSVLFRKDCSLLSGLLYAGRLLFPLPLTSPIRLSEERLRGTKGTYPRYGNVLVFNLKC